MNNLEIMRLGIEEARKTMKQDIGGPFGAVVVKDIKKTGTYIGIPARQI